MQYKKWLFSSISIIFLYLSIWLMMWTSSSLLNHPQDDLAQFLPKESKFAIRVYGDHVIQKFYRELLFYKNDPTHQNQLKEIIAERIKASKEDTSDKIGLLQNLKGVDYYNDFIFFQFTRDRLDFDGILCHISDSTLFNHIQPNTQSIFKTSKNNVGLILISENKGIKTQRIRDLANKMLSTKHNELLNLKRTSKDAIADLYCLIPTEKSTFSKLTIELNANEHKISLSGKSTPSIYRVERGSSYVLQGKNLNFYARYIPDFLNTMVQKWLTQANLPPLKLQEIQVNYEGLEIEFNPTQLTFKPKFEAIVKTSQPLDIKNYLSNQRLLNMVNGTIDSNHLAINETKYYFEQLNNCSFYIGDNDKPIYEKIESPGIVTVKGKLNHLTTISTGGMDFLLNIVPLYAALNRYFLVSENATLNITENGNSAIINGSLEFRGNQNAFFESFYLGSEIQELSKLLK